MKQKFRVSWQIRDIDVPIVAVFDNWIELSGALNALVKEGVLFVDISIIEDN